MIIAYCKHWSDIKIEEGSSSTCHLYFTEGNNNMSTTDFVHQP